MCLAVHERTGSFLGGFRAIWFFFPLAAAVGLIQVGCGGAAAETACPVSTGLRLEVAAAGRLNPDLTGRSLPTTVRVHQLSEVPPGLVELAPPEFWEPAGALQEAIVRSDEFVAFPGTRIFPELTREEDTVAVLTVALVHNEREPVVRSVSALPQLPECRPQLADSTRIAVWLEGYTLESRVHLGCDSVACVSERSHLASLLGERVNSESLSAPRDLQQRDLEIPSHDVRELEVPSPDIAVGGVR